MRAASWILSLVIVVASLAFYFTSVDPIKNYMKLGLDLQGGVHIKLKGVDDPEIGPVTKDKIEKAKAVIENRINKLGVSEPVVMIDGQDRIVVEIAGVLDTDEAQEIIGKTAVLKFVDPDGNTVLDGRDVAEATASSMGGVGFAVNLKLKGEGSQKFADATTKFNQQIITIMLDDEVISAPRVNEPILNGEAQITGNFTAQSATQLANLINGGALPVKLQLEESRVVTATLGADSLKKSAMAGVIGMVGVVLFMLFLYRVPGLMANLALTVYAILTLGFLISINAVFTLPGVAGLLLSIGMAVDANILIFERIREELRNGKGLRSGIDAGFSRAYSTVIDSNITTALAGVILWYLGSGPVKGFALTLVVGVMISLFTAITVTRWLINLCVATGWFGKSLFGVKEVSQ